MELYIDIRWLLERQAEVLPKHPTVHDFSNLVAAVGRHRVNTPRIGATVDNAWRAAALIHAIIRLRPLPARNALFGAGTAVAYMNAAGEGIDSPYARSSTSPATSTPDTPTPTTTPTASAPGASDRPPRDRPHTCGGSERRRGAQRRPVLRAAMEAAKDSGGRKAKSRPRSPRTRSRPRR